MRRLLEIHNRVLSCRACVYGDRGLESRREQYTGVYPADVVFVLGHSELDPDATDAAVAEYHTDIVERCWKSNIFAGYTYATKCSCASRTLRLEEALVCLAHLEAELREVKPTVLVTLGRDATQLLGLYAGPAWRGRWGTFQEFAVMASWHPSFLALNPVPRYRNQAMTDLRAVRQFLGGHP